MVPGEQSIPIGRTKRVGKKETMGTWVRWRYSPGTHTSMWWWQLLLVDCAAPLRTASGHAGCNEEVPTASLLSVMGSVSLALLPCLFLTC